MFEIQQDTRFDGILKETHPGFTITCDDCGSTEVYVENTYGFSETSGSWGDVSLNCHRCNRHVVIFE